MECSALIAILLTDSELSDYCTVTLDIFLLKVVEKVTSSSDHLEESASGMMILLMVLEMFGEVSDPLCENSDLNFGRTGIIFAETVCLDDSSFFFLEQHGYIHPFIIIFRAGHSGGQVLSPQELTPQSRDDAHKLL